MPIPKPLKCEGCPFYSLSKYITPDYILKDSSILILAQNPGENEEQGLEIVDYVYYNRKREPEINKVVPQPLIGATGYTLKKDFWPFTKLNYSQVSKANVIKCRPNGVNDLPTIGSNKPINGITVKMLKEAIHHCTTNYLRIPDSINFIMAMGSISLYHLTGEIKIETEELDSKGNTKYKKEGITEWRGNVLGYGKTRQNTKYSNSNSSDIIGINSYYHPNSNYVNVFPVLHTASLFKSQQYYHATLLDFTRFGKLVRGEWPITLPEIKINEIPSIIPTTIGFDTEYDPTDNNRLIMWSMSDIRSNIYVVDSEYSHKLDNLPSKINLITQNGLVDLPHFLPLIENTDLSKINMEDCMLAHATLWTGEPNSLDYMLSKYGLFNRHKHLRISTDKYTQYLYAGLDAETTLNHVWKSLIQEFKADPLSYNEYKRRRQPLLYIINRFQNRGVKLNQDRIALIIDLLNKELEEIESRAKEITGNPDFNIASHQQVGRGIYEGEYTTVNVKDSRDTNKASRKVRDKSLPKDSEHVKERSTKKVSSKTVKSIIAKLNKELV